MVDMSENLSEMILHRKTNIKRLQGKEKDVL